MILHQGQVTNNKFNMKTAIFLLKMSILGMLITTFFIYVEQATFGQYIFSFELDILKFWNEQGSDKGSYIYLLYVLGLWLYRFFLIFLTVTNRKNLFKDLILSFLYFIVLNIFGLYYLRFIFFQYYSFIPHVVFFCLSVAFSYNLKKTETSNSF